MLLIAEKLPVFLQREDVPIGVHALFVQSVQRDKVVAHLVRGVGELENDLLTALGDAPQTDGKAVAGEDGEHNAHGAAAQLGTDIGGDLVHGGVIALSAGHNGFGHGHNVPVPDGKAVLRGAGGVQDGLGNDVDQIVPLTDDGGPETSGNGADGCL